MKKKIFSILFALVLVLSFGLVTAVPAGASPDPRTLEVSPRTLPTIVLDGVISAGEWGVPDFTDNQTNPGPVEFNVYVESDDENLYIAAEYVSGDFSVAQSLGLATALNIYIDANPPTPFDGVVDDGDLAVIASNDEIFIPYDPGANDWDWQGSGSFSAAGGALAVDGDYMTGNGIVEVKIPFSMMGALPGDTIGLLFQAFGYSSCPVVPDVHPCWPETYTHLALLPFSSIQAAINAADAGDVIDVATGTYDEAVIVDESVELLGANAGVCAGVNPGTRGPETVIDGRIDIQASNVVIDGIKLINGLDSLGEHVGIYMIDQSHITITNSILVGPVSPAKPANAMILGSYGGTAIIHSENISVTCCESYDWNMGAYGNPGGGFSTDYLFQYNNFHDNSHCGLGLDVIGVSVLNNDIIDNGNVGIEAFRDNTVVHCNNIHGNTNYGIYFNTSVYGATFLDATLNWWGDVSGPHHPGSWDYYGVEITNPDGLGDNVTDYVLYEPWKGQEGMATGGGWFIAENNDNFVGTTPGGKATFGFVAKQKKGTSSGQLEFQYNADNLKLKSTSYDWVSVAAVQVMFQGEGILNGVPGYKFRVRAVDGDKLGTGTDRFEIRIWTGGSSYDSPTYRVEGDLGGGQIVVHKK